jgi:hypothetical protein
MSAVVVLDRLLLELRGDTRDQARQAGKIRPLLGAPASCRIPLLQALKAHVHNGRLVLDAPTDLPEGTVVPLRIDGDDDMDEDERARLHEALRRSIAQAKAGQHIDGDEVIGKLLARG